MPPAQGVSVSLTSGGLRLDSLELDRLLVGPDGPAVQHVVKETRRVLNYAKIECPVDTGRLRASHVSKVEVVGKRAIVGSVGSDLSYAKVVHDGRKAITAPPGKRLVFQVGGRTVYARHVRAVKGNPWLERAMTRAGYSVGGTGGRDL